ncbi:MAG: energy-coupling factor transporter transmembrane protein EcfT [Clostridiales Family XIII bacterium]|jgi:energy-coupling factor transporter transmembrane protein EcfT|nr:energy-coupling factor transporter transmembrane protein EcfT [Clostridiales Family XIII bacterium]
MAGITFFHYIHKDTALHRMDGRLKLLCVLLLSLAAGFAQEWHHYLAPLGIAVAAIAAARLPVAALLKDMKFFAAIIIIVLVSDAFNIPGDPIPGFPIASVTMQGVEAGLRFAARLTIIIMVCTAMTGTTSLLTFKNVIEWYLRPVPFVPEVRVATMINLTFVLIPVIFDSFSEMMDAQKARGVQSRKNLIKRVGFMVVPLLSQTLRRADEIVYAMESRCYSELRTRAVFKAHGADWGILALCLAALAFVALARFAA